MTKFVRIFTIFTALFLLKTSAFAGTLTVTNLDDSGAGSLRQAVLEANSGDVISFLVSGTIVLKTPIPIAENINILAPDTEDVIVSGGGLIQPFNISGNVMIRNLHIINGKSETGGAIAASGKLILDNCTLTMNSATEGGALFIT